MTIPSPLLEKKELVAMVRPFPLQEKEENAMIMHIPSPLLNKKEMVAMVMPFPHLEKDETVIMTLSSLLWENNENVIMIMSSPFWKRKSWWPWSYHSLF